MSGASEIEHDWLLWAIGAFIAGGGRVVFRTTEQWDELQRTRITPGADPRSPWSAKQEQALFEYYRIGDDGVLERERGRRGSRGRSHRRYYIECRGPAGTSPAFDTIREHESIRKFEADGLAYYVPFDVARWRDAAHRAAMLERARASKGQR